MPRLLVLGYFGAGNLGDDAILTAWLKSRAAWLRSHSVRLTIVSRSSDPLGGFVETDDLAQLLDASVTPLQALRLDPREFEALVAPGGSLLQDSTSLRSLLLYLAVAERFRASRHGSFFINQGLGPLRSLAGRMLCGAVLGHAAMLSWRDAKSLELAASLPALTERRNMPLSADPVAAVPLDVSTTWPEQLGLAGTYAVVVPKGSPPGLPAGMEKLAVGEHMPVAILPLHETQDLPASQRLLGSITGATLVTSEAASIAGPHASVRMSVISGARLVISVRLHGLIVAAAHGVPAVGLAYDPKVRAFCEEIGYACLPLEAPAAEIARACKESLEDFDAGQHSLRLAGMRARFARAEQRLDEVWNA